MAATQYQVLYRYMSEITHTPITNDTDTEYKATCEFYTDPDHKIFSSDLKVQNEELEKQQELITKANAPNDDRRDMLFVFNGTKRVAHKVWVPDQIGYVVRDWTRVRDKIGSNGDYSKDFTTIGAQNPEDGGKVVCTQRIFDKYFKPYKQENFGGLTTSDTIKKAMIESTIFKIADTNWQIHAVPGENSSQTFYTAPGIYAQSPDGHWNYNVAQPGTEVKIYYSNIVVDALQNIDYMRNYLLYASVGWQCGGPLASTTGVTYPIAYISNSKMYRYVHIDASDIETTTIPGHYEDASEAPYAIMDQYTRIENSPWLINCTVGSLKAALEKARILVDMIGIENVRIIKVVPFAQYIDIK